MSVFEKMERQREAEKLLQKKESLAYSKELIPLMLECNSSYDFELTVGSSINDRILSITAYDKKECNNSSMTLYGFDSKERKKEKVKIIKDMFNGKVKLENFSDMIFY